MKAIKYAGQITIKNFTFRSAIMKSVTMICAMTIVLGLLYPLAVTGIATILFPHEASGSLIYINNRPVGSAMIGQDFTAGAYFQSRPSATAQIPYNAAASGGTNWGTTNPKLKESIQVRVTYWQQKTGSREAVPADLITASSSGLDPHISEAAARYQASTVARQRGIPVEVVEALINEHVQTGITNAAPYVNVLTLNIALDRLLGQNQQTFKHNNDRSHESSSR